MLVCINNSSNKEFGVLVCINNSSIPRREGVSLY